MGSQQRVPRSQTALAGNLPRHDPIETTSGVPSRRYLHMQSPGAKILVVASISSSQKEIAVIKEIEVDPDGSLTRRWATRADDVRVKRTMVALEANGITVVRASDAAAAKQIVLDLIPDATSVHQGASQT